MTKDEVMKLLVLIESVYSNCSLKDETVLQWFQFCAEMDYAKVLARLKTHIRKSPFPPAIGEIAVFTYEENHFPATLQEWMKKGRERIECEYNVNNRIPIPEWLAEYSTRKSI
ncbi:replicative helicase loader/inhibitor [Neobacillus sp. FSL H8-0543]|uniref:replicative helicase loader/inhibitor n=1 Tax=Neobacillus sp. FSL H8-0543 TaxID=2954672 RepID=UPI003158D431